MVSGQHGKVGQFSHDSHKWQALDPACRTLNFFKYLILANLPLPRARQSAPTSATHSSISSARPGQLIRGPKTSKTGI